MGDSSDDDELAEINHRWGRRAISTARIASSAARLAGRRLFGRKASITDQVIGEKLAAELDEMKGMAMKLGQIISYFDGILPESTHAALRPLQRGAKPVAFSVMLPVIESAFEAPLGELFEDFDDVPVAAASIGQVYRARFRGADVAVKVQYPNVRKTFESDTKRLRRLAGLASLATAVDGHAIADELRARLLEECDYELEARHQEAFAAAFADDARIVVPTVVWERTRGSVLTTAWHSGLDFYAFNDAAGPDQRAAAASALVRFAYRSLYGHAAINADPHPGNYLFPGDGRVVFLDFGCVRRFDPDFLERERTLARVVLEDRRGDFRDAVLATGMVPKPKRFDFDVHWAQMCHHYAPYRVPRYRINPEHLAEAMRFNGPSNPNLRRLAIPPQWIWLQRLQFGLHAVLARLDVELAYGDILREALAEPPRPLRVRFSA
jgi:predicted unusual protein kinase regulating ubiquinone biosynthesis (AarF/ABC1/UbiB family)